MWRLFCDMKAPATRAGVQLILLYRAAHSQRVTFRSVLVTNIFLATRFLQQYEVIPVYDFIGIPVAKDVLYLVRLFPF